MPQATAPGTPGYTGTLSNAAASLTPPQQAVAEQRYACCAACPRCTQLDPHQAHCTAAPKPVSLLHGRCPLRKWPAPTRDPSGSRVVMPAPPPPPPEVPGWVKRPPVPHATHRSPKNQTRPGRPCREVFVYGFPGLYAGANTELHHQVILWRSMGLAVHLIPSGPGCENEPLYPEMIERGVIVHSHDTFEAITPGSPVLGFCNDRFLARIDRILERSHNTVFVNCMTWLFGMEKQRHREGKIAAFLYQNNAVREKSRAALQAINPDPEVQYLDFKPYFHAEAFPFVDPAERDVDVFTIGRVSRQDADKFSAETLSVWEGIGSPVTKRGVMLGFGRASEEKIGTPPAWVTTHVNQHTLSQQGFFRQVDVIVQPTDTTENWPRIGLEAMASGAVLIVDNRGGWQQMIEHGKTGWLCDTPDDFIKYGTRMAHEPEERTAMARAARQRLDKLAGPDASRESWAGVLQRLGVRGAVASHVPVQPVEG